MISLDELKYTLEDLEYRRVSLVVRHENGKWVREGVKKEEEYLIPLSYNLPRDAGRAAGRISRL